MKRINRMTLIVTAILLGCSAAVSISWIYFGKQMDIVDMYDRSSLKTYEKEYSILVEDEGEAFWQSLCESAAASVGEDTYLRIINMNENTSYTMADYLKICLTSGSDGIVVHAEQDSQVQKRIQEAAEKGIPVVNVLDDLNTENTTTSVGLNSYELSEAYSSQILECMQPGMNRILFLKNDTSTYNLAISQIRKNLESGKGEDQELEVRVVELDEYSEFTVEETVRDLLMEEQTPDILVCLSEVFTECAYQALLDYNLVGQVQVIGFYYSEEILDAIRNGSIHAAVVPDAQEAGRYCVEAIDDYLALGFASDFYSISLSVITKENADDFGKEESE